MHILIAPNAFKNSVDAVTAANAIEQGLLHSKFNLTSECFPIGDGGDGTADLIIKHFNGTIVKAEVPDALGRKIKTTFGLINGGTDAVIEMANASGLRHLQVQELNPMLASSSGTGELIKAALNKGVSKIIIAMGGSATVDGGTGILRELGVQFLDADRCNLENLPENLIKLDSIDLSLLDNRILDCELIILCDVDNLLLGINGAAAIFGPQKGANPEMIKKLEDSLVKYNDVVFKQTGINMSLIKFGGTAGGAAAGLSALAKAKLVNGIDHFLHLTNFDEALNRSDVVITGEGSIDNQTLQGKGPFGVARRAKQKGIAVIGLAGRVPLLPNPDLEKYFDVLLSIEHEPLNLHDALELTTFNLKRVAMQIAKLIFVGRNNL